MPIDTNFSDILRAINANIIKKGVVNNYNSTGNYCSFGNKVSYKKIGNSSVK